MFLSFVQGFIVSLVIVGRLDVNDDDDRQNEEKGVYPDFYRVNTWKARLLCLECLPLAILMMWAYPAAELHTGDVAASVRELVAANPALEPLAARRKLDEYYIQADGAEGDASQPLLHALRR